MEMISIVEHRLERFRIGRILSDFIEIHERVERAAADPLVDRLPDLFAFYAVVRSAFIRRERATDDFDRTRSSERAGAAARSLRS